MCGTRGRLTEHRAAGPCGRGTGPGGEVLSKAQPRLCPSSLLLLSKSSAIFSLGFHVCGEHKMASTQLPRVPCAWTLQADQSVVIPNLNSQDRDSKGPRSGLLCPPGSGTGGPRNDPRVFVGTHGGEGESQRKVVASWTDVQRNLRGAGCRSCVRSLKIA